VLGQSGANTVTDLDTIDATYRAVTPMFLGGADNERAEFRLPSFKGMLRFWWRALAWKRLNGALEAIHREEAQLFGSADEGQANLLLKAEGDFPEPLPQSPGRKRILRVNQGGRDGRVIGPGARYLGYGALQAFDSSNGPDAGELLRACLPAGFTFDIHGLFRPNTPAEQKVSIKRAMILLGLFGGLGSKSRKGYGSLTLENLEGKDTTRDLDAFVDNLWTATEAIRSSKAPTPAKYTALTDQSQFILAEGFPEMSALELLDALGKKNDLVP